MRTYKSLTKSLKSVKLPASDVASWEGTVQPGFTLFRLFVSADGILCALHVECFADDCYSSPDVRPLESCNSWEKANFPSSALKIIPEEEPVFY